MHVWEQKEVAELSLCIDSAHMHVDPVHDNPSSAALAVL